MKNLITRFVKDESGATAIEYGLIAAGISLAIIAVVNGLGTTLLPLLAVEAGLLNGTDLVTRPLQPGAASRIALPTEPSTRPRRVVLLADRRPHRWQAAVVAAAATAVVWLPTVVVVWPWARDTLL